MWGYDLTGGFRIGKLHKRISVDEALAHVPTLRRERLAPSYLYYDAQADDARLTLTIARTAATDFGAAVANRVEVVEVLKDSDGRARGARVRAAGANGAAAREFDVRAAAVVNAGGVWADDVRALDEREHPNSIRPAKGIHITVPWSKVQNDIAAVIPVPKDKRSVFVVPWGDFTYIGTTDTDYDGPIEDPAMHAGRHRVPAAGHQRIGVDRTSRSTTSRAHGPVCARSCATRAVHAPPTCHAVTG